MKISKELIVETALALINEEGSSSKVNLREIARRLGCAHTNIYNYYPSLDELLGRARRCAPAYDRCGDLVAGKGRDREIAACLLRGVCRLLSFEPRLVFAPVAGRACG